MQDHIKTLFLMIFSVPTSCRRKDFCLEFLFELFTSCISYKLPFFSFFPIYPSSKTIFDMRLKFFLFSLHCYLFLCPFQSHSSQKFVPFVYSNVKIEFLLEFYSPFNFSGVIINYTIDNFILNYVCLVLLEEEFNITEGIYDPFEGSSF